MQLIRRYWHRSHDRRRRIGGLLAVELSCAEPDSFLEKHGMAPERRPTSDVINVVQQSRDRYDDDDDR